jgi:endonuclease-3
MADSKKSKPKLPRKSKKQLDRAQELLEALYEEYPGAECALHHRNAFELLIATILSAQCTDERVNKVTPRLFKDYPSPEAFAEADIHDIEEAVRSTGFYRNKAKSIKTSSQIIVERFDSKVPETMKELLSLRGVARKTANVVLGNAYGKNVGVVVDTHVKRLSNRFGLTKHKNTDKIEKDLMALFPQEHWTNLAHLLIQHGRNACKARMSSAPDHPICNKFGVNCEYCKNKERQDQT